MCVLIICYQNTVNYVQEMTDMTCSLTPTDGSVGKQNITDKTTKKKNLNTSFF